VDIVELLLNWSKPGRCYNRTNVSCRAFIEYSTSHIINARTIKLRDSSAGDNVVGIPASFVDVGEGWRVSGSWGIARWW